MRNRIASLLLPAVLLGGQANAATITLGNAVGEFNPVVSPAGVPIPMGSGFVTTGHFSVADNLITAANVVDTFVPLNPSGGFNFNFAFDGLFSGSISSPDPIETGDPIIGQNIFTVIGNGSSLANSGAFLVVRDFDTFARDNPTFSGEAFLDQSVEATSMSTGEVIVGDFRAVQADRGDGMVVDAFRMSEVPEPATNALLFGLLASGFVWFRRRKR